MCSGGHSGAAFGHEVVPVEVAAFDHVDGDGGALVDDYVFDRGALLQSFVDDGFELDLGAAAIADVLGEDGDALGVVDAVGDGVGGEATEDYVVDGSDAGAGEEGDGQLGAHAHVDGYAVSALDVEGLEDIGEFLNFNVEFRIGEFADFAWFAFPEDGHFVAAGAERVAVDAVVGEVEGASLEPFGVGEGAFEDGGPRGEPV